MEVVEIAAVVCTELERHGLQAVLTGGAVVTIYSENAYRSRDLDFVIEGIAKDVEPAMTALGFVREAGRHWTHPAIEQFVEFPSGPLQLGNSAVTKVGAIETKTGTLRLLTPTQCVMDRLAAFYHWQDPQALDQAVEVAVRHEVKMASIRRWSRGEGEAGRRFAQFRERVRARSG